MTEFPCFVMSENSDRCLNFLKEHDANAKPTQRSQHAENVEALKDDAASCLRTRVRFDQRNMKFSCFGELEGRFAAHDDTSQAAEWDAAGWDLHAAITHRRKALNLARTAYGEESHDRGYSQVLIDAKRYKGAMPILRRAHAIQVDTLSEGHGVTLEVLRAIEPLMPFLKDSSKAALDSVAGPRNKCTLTLTWRIGIEQVPWEGLTGHLSRCKRKVAAPVAAFMARAAAGGGGRGAHIAKPP